MDPVAASPVFGSPRRQFSAEEKESLRSRIIKETPGRLYSSVMSHHHKGEINKNADMNKDVPPIINDEEGAVLDTRPVEIKGTRFSENPILTNFINKSINKEFEFNKLIINIISIFILNLVIKFTKLLYHVYLSKNDPWTTLEKFILPWNDDIDIDIEGSIRDNYNYDWTHWQFYLIANVKLIIWIMDHIDTIQNGINSIIIFNIIVSLIKLFSYSNASSLSLRGEQQRERDGQLSMKQRDLLGLDKSAFSMQEDTNKPHQIIFSNNNNNKNNKNKNKNTEENHPVVPSTPYLFKSLRTPMRQSQEVSNKSTSNNITLPHKYNGNIFNTPGNRTTTNPHIGYIPSNKYAYMMNSPSPMKRR